MKIAQIWIALLLGIFTILLEFRSYVIGGLLGPDLFKYFLIFILLLLLIVYFVIDIIQYRKTKKYFSFSPTITCLFLLLVVFGHMYGRDQNDSSKSLFKAVQNKKINERESLTFDFKENGHLKAIATNKFTDNYYWGSYKKSDDTLFINLKTDFNLGQKAIVKGDTMHLIGDTIYYLIRK